jgi:4-amino-4-deoxy-L-arabinose transferase-like glycosyltransferase
MAIMADQQREGPAELHRISVVALALIVGATVFWTVYPHLTQLNLDAYIDMLENHAWGIRWQWGNPNHPPLFGWLTAAWFEIFPRTDLSYRLLAALNIGAGLGLMVLIARRFLTPSEQAAAVMVALVMPPLGFLAFTYNANSAMLPFWAGTILFYLRVIERRRMADAALLGAFAGAAILSKYFAAVLLLALLGHALSNRQTRAILASPIPVVAAIVFLLVVGPHLLWLFGNGFSSVVFATRKQGDASIVALMRSQIEFLIAQPLYALPGLAVLGLLRRPNDGSPWFDRRAIAAAFGSTSGKLLLWTGLATVPLTMALALVLQVPLTSNWSLPIFSVVPIVLTLLLPRPVAERMRGWTIGLSIGFMVLMLALSPLIRSQILERAHANNALPLRALAEASGALWSDGVDEDVAFVAGHRFYAMAASFYLPSRPHFLEGPDIARQPWAQGDPLARSGVLVICGSPADTCIEPWQSDADWRVEPLGTAEIPAVPGAGGPPSYPLLAFRAVYASVR